MTPKAQHWAKTLFELTKDAKPADGERVVARIAAALRAKNRAGMLERVLLEYR